MVIGYQLLRGYHGNLLYACGHCAVTMVTYSMRAVGAADLPLFFVHPAGILKG